ncbi:MAG: amidohydrolase family protein [Desulfitobacteriaceae bacterium]|nr:amidohydrolase family protein [Desulfitobacteriaceae bacterium]
MGTLAITNIGTIVSGDLKNPVRSGNTVLVRDGKIVAIGDAGILSGEALDKTVDAQGITLIPGMLDSHVHPVFGDFTPRQKMMDYIESSLHGGVTTMISAGEPHLPGRPKDPVGVKALAILASRSFRNARPGGVKVYAGALILEQGLQEADFAELKEAGVWLVGEIGLGSVRKPEDAAPMVAWAHKYGFKVAMHTGGTSIPGSSTVTADDVLAIKPDVVSHINGGTTAVAPAEVRKIIELSDFAIEVVQCGNPKAALQAVEILSERNELSRLIMGNDAPSGTGVIPLGMLRNLAFLVSVGSLDPAQSIAAATGNTARVFGLNTGIIEIGREADLVLVDAPMGSFGQDALEGLKAGDIPGVAMVIVDGEIKAGISRNTPPPTHKPVIK